MCAIIGIASTKSIVTSNWLIQGRDSMQHRGPDAKGEWWSFDHKVGFGHRRLSIIDLSFNGQQPMLDEFNELSIVFNGEIYNYNELRSELIKNGLKFRFHNDTEVILAAYRYWGADCLIHFSGMFAFALYDSRLQRLLVARDRAGEKPLFYSNESGTFRFSSELKGLMADPALSRTIDLEALDCYLAQGYVPRDLSILKGIKKLQAGHALAFDINNGNTKIWQYWKLPPFDGSFISLPNNERALVDELEILLKQSVRQQLVADVPVGILLSGGVDSSLITAMSSDAKSDIKTFTVRFPGYSKYDETEHARLVAEYFGTKHIELEAEALCPEILHVLAKQFDEPLIDSSMIPTYLISKLIKQYCTVALGGDGGDELFGGYGHYNRLVFLQKKSEKIPLWSRKILAAITTKMLPLGYKGRNWLRAMGSDFSNNVPLIASYYDSPNRSRLLGWSLQKERTAEYKRNLDIADKGDLLQRATRMDFRNYLSEDILVKVDRASMLNSLEIRAPMLDYRVIEFAYRNIQSDLKATANNRKILLKQLASKLLPPAFDLTRKQGFSIPLSSWIISGPWAKFFAEVLLDNDQTIFDKKVIRNLINGQRRGRNNSERLFGLVIFELWRKEYNIKMELGL